MTVSSSGEPSLFSQKLPIIDHIDSLKNGRLFKIIADFSYTIHNTFREFI